MTKLGSGTLTYTGANTYTGGTTINAGTLQIGNGGTSGSITGSVSNGGALTFNRSDSTAFDGVISGAGAVTKLGAVQEGILRSHRFTETGRIRDTVYFSILEGEWPAVKGRLTKRLQSVSN